MSKLDCFNGFVCEILNWYSRDVGGDWNDLSKLKVLKLLFLSVAEDDELLYIFDNFVAWDLWPVEEDIYKAIIKGDENLVFDINNECTIRKKDILISPEAIEKWKQNINLIKKSASSLVDITHEWRCWRIANMLWKLKLSNELILESNKFYWNETV